MTQWRSSIRTIQMAIHTASAHDQGMRLPAPRFHRIAVLVLIDVSQCVALLPASDAAHGAWTLPRRAVGLRQSYGEAAAQLASNVIDSESVRRGTVTGHLWAPPPSGNSPRTEARYFIARTDRSAERPALNSPARWVPRPSLLAFLEGHELATTTVLVDGYLDGWLPDGPITLD